MTGEIKIRAEITVELADGDSETFTIEAKSFNSAIEKLGALERKLEKQEANFIRASEDAVEEGFNQDPQDMQEEAARDEELNK